MRSLPFETLLQWILKELGQRQSIFGIHRSHFYVPQPESPFSCPDLFGHFLATPIGPAAGPHTQLAQNIVSAWLCGGRFVELKTVQVMDELEIPRPCIDMEDEGYNVEWSQELKLDQSAEEYIKAWALIHILHRVLGIEGQVPVGTIFNMSVGYTLEGIQSAPMQRFLHRMADASADLAAIRAILQARCPELGDLEIPSRVAGSVTLSTMHGCPPEEIEQIAGYLLAEKSLHTMVKLNPALLGKSRILEILHADLGYGEIEVSNSVFDHELSFDRAVTLIRTLQQKAAARDLTFGVKLSNTLAVRNHRSVLPGAEMYLSGRALYPLAIELFHRLTGEFPGGLKVSYSGGADALNVATLLASGAMPVTVASDLLKPGGCVRFLQHLQNLETVMRDRRAGSLAELSRDRLANLAQAAAEARVNPRYRRRYYSDGLPKVDSGLGWFDCITAPCMERCAVNQDVPEYARLIALGEVDRALASILARNPLPGVTGHVCTQLCRTCCTRSASNYDEPVLIRALKRYAAENGRVELPAREPCGRKVAVIGSGPSGLAAACFLALQGIRVTIFEARDTPGGMMCLAPAFRLPLEVIRDDISRILNLGVDLRLSHPVERPPEQLLQQGFDAVYVASGFQKNIPLPIEGIRGSGVIAALDLLGQVRHGRSVDLGPRVLVIGGGDTALDAARVARRITGRPATIVYRRTLGEIPAREEDREGAWEEGIKLEELVSPVRVVRKNGRVVGLDCVRNRSGEREADGRRRPIPVEGSEFRIDADSIIVALGQSPDLAFLDGSAISLRKDGSIAICPDSGAAGIHGVYAGGDAVRGPESIITACADGRRAAEAICRQFKVEFHPLPAQLAELSEEEVCRIKHVRARREMSHPAAMLPPGERSGFDLIEATLGEAAARREAARCLQCASVCDKCVEVCPNRANLAYAVRPERLTVPILSCREAGLIVERESAVIVNQARQILHLPDLCNECGNCATFCVHAGRPYRDKPRLYFLEEDFQREHFNALFIERNGNGWTVKRRDRGRESQLALKADAGELIFENDHVRAVFSEEGFAIRKMELKRHFPGELRLAAPAEMYVIARGVLASLAYLPGL